MPTMSRRRRVPTAARVPARLAALVSLAASIVALLSSAPAASAATGIQLTLSQSTAFAILGHWCGGIQEQALATGFAPTTGYPAGDVYLLTRCSSGGRGGGSTTYTAWAGVSWDFSGNVSHYSTLTSAPTGLNPSLKLFGPSGDEVYNVITSTNVSNCTPVNVGLCSYRAYFYAPVPAPPTGVTATQTGDQFQVSWKPAAATVPLLSASTVTATPVTGTTPVLTATVGGSTSTGLIGPLAPSTPYRITVVNTDAGGTSPASAPISVTSQAATVVPSVPTGVTATWTNGGPMAASWQAPTGGNSPIDAYQATASPYDADPSAPPPIIVTVSGTTLSAYFGATNAWDWSVTVRAHNAAGWGPWSPLFVLSGG